jgi:hypothetical protein
MSLAGYVLTRLFVLLEHRNLRAATAEAIPALLAAALDGAAQDEPELRAVRDETRSGLRADFFFPDNGVIILIDRDGRLAVPETLGRFFAVEWVTGIAVLTPISPDAYPAGNSTRAIRRGKELTAIRIDSRS